MVGSGVGRPDGQAGDGPSRPCIRSWSPRAQCPSPRSASRRRERDVALLLRAQLYRPNCPFSPWAWAAIARTSNCSRAIIRAAVVLAGINVVVAPPTWCWSDRFARQSGCVYHTRVARNFYGGRTSNLGEFGSGCYGPVGYVPFET